MARLARHAFATLVSLLFLFLWLAAGNPDPFGPWIAALAQEAPCAPNPIVCENLKPSLGGDSNFEVGVGADPSIQGFATEISVNVGQTVQFKIAAPAGAEYVLDVYRLGYYAGAGARKVAVVTPSAFPDQPACLTDAATGLVDCGNWTVSASWAVPADATSGIYIAAPRVPGSGHSSQIVFIVRDDNRKADILVQTSDTTWQAYNRYGGASLYCADAGGISNGGSAYANSCARRATKVSYNRPFDTRAHSPQSFLFSAEYPMLRFLEANGYNVKYWAGVDTDRRGADLVGVNKPNVFISSGHDEYWSGNQRASVEAARNAGVNLAFFSGNEIYWKTRYEPSAASRDEATSNPAFRTLVSYKDTLAGVKLDPMPKVATGTWRDTRLAAPVADGGRPENALIGSMWTVNSGTSAIAVPPSMANLRLWRNTRIAAQGGGTLAPSSLGYEWGEDLDNGSRPAGVIHLSSTTVAGVEKIVDFGATVANGTATHSLTLYRHQSGALVFGASTVQWAWGLDAVHDDHAQSLPSHTPDLAMQQATVNLLADMGAQPASLLSSLTAVIASTDALAPTTVINSPVAGGAVGSGDRVTIAGTASDNGGGAVAAVEVSVDGGSTWRAARGTSAWTYEWAAGPVGTATIRARATDDSGNQDPVGVARTVTIVGRCPCPSIWSASAVPAVLETADPSPVELGLKFRSDIDGFVKGVRFYKGAGNTGTHVGNLWTSTGTLLARVTFAGETASGWQEALFDQPVDIDANTTYVVSYHTNVGQYSSSGGYFTTLGADAAPLHALPTGAAGGNGVYAYGATGFPTQTFNATNYWVDVVFDSAPDTLKPVIADVTATAPDSATALIAWSTNEAATSIVEYSTDSTFPAAQTVTVADLTLTLTHSVRITNLRADTRYHFRLKSTDRAGNEGTWPPAGTPQPGTGGTPLPREFTTPKPTLHDTTAADFSGGIPSSVHVAEAGDGEIILAPGDVAEFSGTALPTGWSETIWSDGGSSKVGGGRLTVDGARVVRDQAEALPGHSLEFVATLTGDPYQHSGYGQTLASTFEPLALFSTSWVDVDSTPRAGGSLAARTSTGDGAEMSTNLGPAYFNAPHRYRIDWQPAAVTYSIDGVQVASHAVAIAEPLRPVAASDFNAFSGTISVDWMRLSPYVAGGSFLSRVFDAGGAVDWNDIRWTAETPDGTSLAIAVRGGTTATPDESWTGFTPVSAPGPLALRARYVQYRASLATDSPDRTPALQDIVISSTQPSLAATDDRVVVAENGQHVFPASGAGSLTANDADSLAAATLRVVAVTAPVHGAAVLQADGSVLYRPATNYHGADAFGYTVSDGTLTASATVVIDVTGNIAPIANADRFDVDEDGSLRVTAASGVLANDTDAEHDPMTVRLVSPPSHGVLALGADGSFSYTPAQNFAGADEFTYKANDGVDDSANAAAVQISIAAINDAPSFTTGPDQVVLEDAGAQVVPGWATQVSAGDAGEAAQALQFLVETTGSALFAVQPAIAPNGTLSYTPAANANGSAVVTVRLRDDGGSVRGSDTSATAAFSITLVPVNDPPTIADIADQTSTGSPVGPLTVKVGDVDDATAASLALTAVSSNPALATIAVGGSGADRTVTVTPVAGQTGQATMTLTVDDGRGATARDTFVLTLSSVRVAPTSISLASSATTATTYGQSITYTSTVSGSKGTATGTVTFYDGNFALGPAAALDATGKATLSTTTTPAGTRAITAVYSGDSKYTSITSTPISQTVNKAAATATLTLNAVQKQYSDVVGATVSVSPPGAAQSVTFKSGTKILGTFDVVDGKGTINVPMLNVSLGANMVTAVFNQAVANYTVPSPVKPITIAAEDATVAYANPTDVIICRTCANTLTLVATVKDITVTNPLGDPDAGDIGNATVSFVNRATGLTIGTAKVVRSAADPRIGTATFSWPLTIATGSSQSYTVGMVVGSFYRNGTTANVVVTATKQ